MVDKGLLARNAGLRGLLTALLISEAGTWIAYVALTVAVYAKTGSPAWVSVVLLAGFAPNVVLAPVVGVLADRVSRRRLLIVSDLCGAAVFAVAPFVVEAWQLVALAAVAGAAAAVFRPTLMSAVPNLVEESDLERANGALQTMSNLGLAAGPALAGVMVAATGTGIAFAANAASFAASALLVARLPGHRFQSADRGEESIGDAAANGFRIFTRNRMLAILLGSWMLMGLAAGAINVGEILLAKETFGAGTAGFGLLASCCGAGLVLGSFLSARLLEGRDSVRLYGAGLAVSALAFGGAAVAPALWVAAGLAICGGFGNGLLIAAKSVVLQRAVPDDLRGRAFALIFGCGDAAMGAGMVVAGIVAAAFGARALWGAGAVALALAALATLAAHPRRRRQPGRKPEILVLELEGG
jgi:MFS family permease